MITIQDYKKVPPSVFYPLFKDALGTSGKSFARIAADLDIKAINTVKNAFDKEGVGIHINTLSSIINNIGMDAIIVYAEGKREFYIKK